jgi:hypothetical protein
MRLAILLLSVLIAVGARPASEEPLFAPAPGSPIRVGPGSGTLILADVDADGRLDLLSRHLQTRVVAVQLGNGTGAFAPAPSPLTVTYAPGDMAVGDLDDDGVLDLAVTPSDRDVVDVFLGDGRGAFSKGRGSPFTVTAAIDPLNKRTLQLVDLNADGRLDAVTANGRKRNTFGVLFGDGRGGFSKGPIVALDSDRDGYSFAFGDLDGDGRLDVVCASRASYDDNGPGRVVVQIGDGKGGFTPTAQSPLSVPSGPRVVAVGDLNGDRRADVAIAHVGGRLSILLNDGRGRLAQAPGSPLDLGIDAFALRAADVNRDGRPDLVAATVNSVTVLLGDGRGFAPAGGSPFKAGPGAYNLAIGDVNADGKPDVAASSFESDAVTLLLGR